MKFKLAYLLIPVLIYVSVVAMLWLFQGRMLFHPLAELVSEPASDAYTFKNVTVNTQDGERLHAWFLMADEDSPVVLFFHGNAGNISHRIDTLELLVGSGASVFIVDYRGYGASSGKPSERGLYLDAKAAWRHLVIAEGVDEHNVIIFGRSLGGGVAAWLATEESAGALVLESTFTTLADLVAEYYPWLPARKLLRFRFDTIGRLADIETDVYVIHSERDELIGYHHGKSLFDAAGSRRNFFTMTGGHNDGFLRSGETYRAAWREIVDHVRAKSKG